MNIALTGFMGTGKSSVGKILAKELGWEFLDTDTLIEMEAGMKIPDIFASRGEQGFRDIESDVIKKTVLLNNKIISCGGGVVLRSENMDTLEKNSIIVCLTASSEKILERTKGSDRPLLKVEDPLKKIEELLNIRSQFYKRCHLSIDTSNINPSEVVKKILNSTAVQSHFNSRI